MLNQIKRGDNGQPCHDPLCKGNGSDNLLLVTALEVRFVCTIFVIHKELLQQTQKSASSAKIARGTLEFCTTTTVSITWCTWPKTCLFDKA